MSENIHIIKNSKINDPANLAAWFVFGCMFFLGLLVYRDYGITWDEINQNIIGILNLNYVIHQPPAFLSFVFRYYGSWFEMLLAMYPYHSYQDLFYFRHLGTFLLFFCSCISFYFLFRIIFQDNKWIGILSAVMLFSSPRIFGDAFNNSKDIPFLSLYVICITTLVWFAHKPSIWKLLLHAILSGLLIGIRIPGLIMIPITLGMLAVEFLNNRLQLKQVLSYIPIYTVLTGAILILSMPILWHDPFIEFVNAFNQMSHYPHNVKLVFEGRIFYSSALPRRYILENILISTPPVFLGLSFLSIPIAIKKFINDPKSFFSTPWREYSLLVTCFLAPLLIVMAIRSTFYDGWRQMYFVFPPFLGMAIFSLRNIWDFIGKVLKMKYLIINFLILFILAVTPQTVWMIKNHPFESCYYNALAGKDMATIQNKYMLDYWGRAYSRGLEYILSTDSSSEIWVKTETDPGNMNAMILPEDQAWRLHFTDYLIRSDYFIGNYYMQKKYPFQNEVFFIKVDNAKILSVFKLSQDEKSSLVNPLISDIQ